MAALTAWSSTLSLLLVLLACGCKRDKDHPSPESNDGKDLSFPSDRDLDLPDLADLDLPDLDLADFSQTDALDLPVPTDLTPPDLPFPTSQTVDIYVDNFCKMNVIPSKFDVPRGTFLKLTYYNRSRDYPVDVWLSYGGGYLDLKTGTSWADRFEFCRGTRPYSAYADISTACSRYRLMFNCL